MKLGNIIVGHSLAALLKSYDTGYPIVLTRFSSPYMYDTSDCPIMLEAQEFRFFSDAWNFVRFLVAMRGLVINPREVDQVRITDQEVVFGRNMVEYETCHLFYNDRVTTNLEIKKVLNKGIYRATDVMRLPFCNVENLDSMKVMGSFIEEVRFFGKKKIVCTSFLTRDQLNNFDYSDTMSRFFVEKALLKEPGLIRPLISPTRGPRNPKPVVLDRYVESWEQTIFKKDKRIRYYDSKNSFNIIKAHCRDNTGSKS